MMPTLLPETPHNSERAAGEEESSVTVPLLCDRCGMPMFEDRCKIACANCGNRFDCSDLNLYFD